jgi:hypothetical protein
MPISAAIGDRASGADTFDQQPPAMDGQPGITAEHQGLRAVKIRHLNHTEAFAMIKSGQCQQRS